MRKRCKSKCPADEESIRGRVSGSRVKVPGEVGLGFQGSRVRVSGSRVKVPGIRVRV